MNNNINLILSIIVFFTLAFFPLSGQTKNSSQFRQWTDRVKQDSSSRIIAGQHTYRELTADITQLRLLLLAEPGAVVITLPLPDGTMADFKLTPSSVVAEKLLEKYPQIKTYRGHQINHPENNGRFDISPQGFHAMFRYDKAMVFIDPLEKITAGWIHTTALIPEKVVRL